MVMSLIAGTKLWITNAGHARFVLVRFHQQGLCASTSVQGFVISATRVSFRCWLMPIHQKITKSVHASLYQDQECRK